MTNSFIFSPAPESCGLHRKLAEAHSSAANLAHALSTELASAYVMNLADTWKRTIEIGHALQKVFGAERACGNCLGQDHRFSQAYQEMLRHHHFAYTMFERMSGNLEKNPPAGPAEVATLAADIKFHMAEAAHNEVQSNTQPQATGVMPGPQA